ncbi:leucine-rich repeat protein SHOC-2-like [Ptychodera flava]|uniref:leucine-rich repeat protein SHOC-2-like n=1 Tax=Ptychodera flava TaxID=63121 RepID=UPI00396A740A
MADVTVECDLSDRQLSHLPGEVLRSTDIEALNLENNQISSLPDNIVHLLNVEELVLRSNKFEQFPSQVLHLYKLVELDIGRNEIGSIPPEIYHLRHLERIYADDCGLMKFPFGTGTEPQQMKNDSPALKTLHTLALQGNPSLNFTFGALTPVNLTRLDVSRTSLRSVPLQMFKLGHLEELYLSQNALQELPHSVGSLKRLKILWVDENKIRDLPPSLGEIENLRELNAHGNRLRTLPSEMRTCKRVEKLNLSDNNISVVPNVIVRMTRMKVFTLGNNKIRDFHRNATNLRKLEYIDFGSNSLASVPNEVCQLRSLRCLILQNNFLEKLPADITKLENLRVLDLSRNRLSELSPQMDCLTQLRELRLGQNGLIELPEWIGSLKQLRELTLDDNKLLELPDSIVELDSLTRLQAANNDIRVLPPNFERRLQKLRELCLDGNPHFQPSDSASPKSRSMTRTKMGASGNKADHATSSQKDAKDKIDERHWLWIGHISRDHDAVSRYSDTPLGSTNDENTTRKKKKRVFKRKVEAKLKSTSREARRHLNTAARLKKDRDDELAGIIPTNAENTRDNLSKAFTYLAENFESKEWKHFGINQLNLSLSVIEAISQDAPNDETKQKYRMMKLWRSRNGKYATYRTLVRRLRDAGLDQLADGVMGKQSHVDTH